MRYDFDVDSCMVTSGDAFNISGSGMSDDGPIRVLVLRSFGQTGISVGVNQPSLDTPPERNFVLVDVSDPSPSIVEVDPAGFSLRASGTFIELQAEDLPRVQGTLELNCQP